MSSTMQRSSSSPSFRNNLPWLLMILSFLYILYTNILLTDNTKDCPINPSQKDAILSISSNSTNASASETTDFEKCSKLIPHSYHKYDTELKHVVFGIAAASNLWDRRKEYIKVWWKPRIVRGAVWMDKNSNVTKEENLPEVRFSEDTSNFKYTHKTGQRDALRISRVVSEMLRMGVKDVRWFVMGDDDTFFIAENVVRVLAKYDHRQFYYVGSSSESHIQNIIFSYNMAFGGGGFAISYPLAKELAKMQDKCMNRYPALYGSDDRMHACMAELGVPLTKEPGFHQNDLHGNLLGYLGSHPVAPFVSLHHLDVVQPVFPGMSRVSALEHLIESAKFDSASLMQQSICYDSDRFWSITVSWGYVVQVMRGVMAPRDLEMPARTFLNWWERADYYAYSFNTRPLMRHPCQRPFLFYVNKVRNDPAKKQTVGIYYREKAASPFCRWRMDSPEKLESVVVIKKTDNLRWQKAPRRDCCRILPSKKNTSMHIWVGNCQEGEYSELNQR